MLTNHGVVVQSNPEASGKMEELPDMAQVGKIGHWCGWVAVHLCIHLA